MKLLVKSFVCLLLLSTSANFAQEFDGYKYFVVREVKYGDGGKDTYGVQNNVILYLKSRGYNVISGGEGWSESLYPKDLKYNPCLAVFVSISHKASPPYDVTIQFTNCKNETFKSLNGIANSSFEKALNKIYTKLNEIKFYSFDESLALTIQYPIVENINKDENEIKSILDLKKPDPIEGIYKSYKSETNYKIGIIKVGEEYKAIIIESELPHWKKGDVKAIFESTSVDGVFSTKFYMADKTSYETFANIEGGLLTIEFKNEKGEKNDLNFLKLFPKN